MRPQGDVVCAGVSAIVINTVNCLQDLLHEDIGCDYDSLQFFAHKKGMGSTKNGRDSNAKRLGAKKADGQFVKAGNILYRQRGTSIHPGLNVGIGGDDTLYALTDGILRFERVGKDKKRASVHPVVGKDKKRASVHPVEAQQ